MVTLIAWLAPSETTARPDVPLSVDSDFDAYWRYYH